MSEDRFPLDAEQIVRLTGTVLARTLNAVRHPDAKPIREGELILALAQATGVDVATQRVPSHDVAGGRLAETVLAPYGYRDDAAPSEEGAA